MGEGLDVECPAGVRASRPYRERQADDCRRFKPGSELGFAAGGSGTLVKTNDGGRSWKRDRSTDEVAGNLYAIKWTKARGGALTL